MKTSLPSFFAFLAASLGLSVNSICVPYEPHDSPVFGGTISDGGGVGGAPVAVPPKGASASPATAVNSKRCIGLPPRFPRPARSPDGTERILPFRRDPPHERLPAVTG